MEIFLASLSTTVLFSVLLWLSRNLILTRLGKSVEYEFNAKIEKLRAELRENDELLKADMRAREAEIVSLRSGAMNAMISRQIAVDKRRLEAIDQLWSAFNALGPAKIVSQYMSHINFEVAASLAENDPKLRESFNKMFGDNFDLKSLNVSSALSARPFISPMAWATFTAYTAVAGHAVMRLHVLKFGLGNEDFADNKAITALIKAALPHREGYVNENGPNSYYSLLEELEEKLLAELRAIMTGAENDKAGVEQAAEIVQKANEVQSNSRVGLA